MLSAADRRGLSTRLPQQRLVRVPRLLLRAPPPQQQQPAAAAHSRRGRPPPAALPAWAQQLLQAAKRQSRAAVARPNPLADELLQLLTQDNASSSSSKAGPSGQQQRIDALLDQIQCFDGLRFQEQLLQGGPWRVLYTRGTPQLWKATFSAGRLVSPSNAASQDLDPADRGVINRAEYWGDKLWVTASGTYEPLDDTPLLPKAIQANITSGLLHVFGLNVPLPIRGTGRFEILYLDGRLRVFRSGGALAVQVNESYLQQQGLL